MTITQTTLADCRKCGISFIDLNGQRMCDACMVERVNGTGILEDDDPDDADLFATPPPDRGAPLLIRVVCAVCTKPCQIPILADGKLCDLCRADLDATAAHITEMRRLADERTGQAWDRWTADLAHADAADRERYDRIEAQREAADFAQRLAKARRLPDWASAVALWDLRSTFDQAASHLDRVRGWAEGAKEEVEAARETL